MGLLDGAWGPTDGGGAELAGDPNETEWTTDQGDITGPEVQGDVASLKD